MASDPFSSSFPRLHTLALVRVEQKDFADARQVLKRALAAASDEPTRQRLTRTLDKLPTHAHD
jgi:hypothetical protein